MKFDPSSITCTLSTSNMAYPSDTLRRISSRLDTLNKGYLAVFFITTIIYGVCRARAIDGIISITVCGLAILAQAGMFCIGTDWVAEACNCSTTIKSYRVDRNAGMSVRDKVRAEDQNAQDVKLSTQERQVESARASL